MAGVKILYDIFLHLVYFSNCVVCVIHHSFLRIRHYRLFRCSGRCYWSVDVWAEPAH